MTTPRATHAAVARPDGGVLCIGGFSSEGRALATTDLFDPRSRAFVAGPELRRSRIQPIAVRIADDRVLVVGGEWDREVSTAEICEPGSGFRHLADLTDRRTAGALALLHDGRVLICGGSRPGYRMTASAELLDPATGMSVPVGPMLTERAGYTATTLADGRVLVAGGGEGDKVLASTEIFDPRSESFSAGPDLAAARLKHGAGRLADGRILIVGGQGADTDVSRGRLAACELYDGQVLTAGAAMAASRYKLEGGIAIFPDGRLIVASGAAFAEVLADGAFQRLDGNFDASREFMTATAISSDEALIAGGYDQDIRTTRRTWFASLATST
jgi:hypothetical protein